MSTREAWLHAVTEQLRGWPEFGQLGEVHISVGFSSKGVRAKTIGECWSGSCSTDERPHIFIHPRLIDPLDVTATLAHELIHATIGTQEGHGKVFKKAALAIGLEGRMTATVAGAGFKARVEPVLAEVGPFPHAQLRPTRGYGSNGPKQSTRMIKCECSHCGYVLRTTRKWLEIATPACPSCDIFMEVAW